jgi:hypothetical protein
MVVVDFATRGGIMLLVQELKASGYHQGSLREPAEVIERAVTAKESKLRYLAGADAGPIVMGRKRMSGEEWVTMERRSTNEAYFAEFAARFPDLP